MPQKFLLLLPFLLPLPVLAQTSPTLLDLQLIAIKARADVASHSPENIAEFAETRRLAETGDVEAQLELARMLQLGVAQGDELALAIRWLKRADEQHFVAAYHALGEHLKLAEKENK